MNDNLVLKRMNEMCTESCSPEQFEAWEKLKDYLLETRKSLQQDQPLNLHINFYDQGNNQIGRATKQVHAIVDHLGFDAEDIPEGAVRWAFELGEPKRITEDEFKQKYGITVAQLIQANKDLKLVDLKTDQVAA